MSTAGIHIEKRGAHHAADDTTLVECGTSTADFANLRRVATWLREQGFSVGTMEGGNPIGIIDHPGTTVAKWSKLAPDERLMLLGHLMLPDAESSWRTTEFFRIVWYRKPPCARLLLDLRCAA